MKSKGSREALLYCDESTIYLASIIVYSGVVHTDIDFFRSKWAKILFEGLGIEAEPLDWYYKIMDRKERLKNGRRSS